MKRGFLVLRHLINPAPSSLQQHLNSLSVVASGSNVDGSIPRLDWGRRGEGMEEEGGGREGGREKETGG